MSDIIYWTLASITAVGVAAMWGWAAGEDEDERVVNAKVFATVASLGLIFFWSGLLLVNVLNESWR